jgi:membrane fusion protein (multidrug efflux system)
MVEVVETPAARKAWVRPVLFGGVLLLLIGTLIGIGRWYTHGRFIEDTDDAYLEADSVTVGTKVAGTVEKVLVADNEAVQAGQPLVELDSRANRARVAQAEAVAIQGRAQAEVYTAQIREQEAAIAEGAAQLAQAQVQARYAEGEVQRYEPLAASGAEPKERLVSRIADRDQAEARLRQAEAALQQARVRLGTLRAQIAVAQAQVQSAEAEESQAQIDVDSAVISASIDGRVGDRTVRLGQQAQVGTTFMTIVPDQNLYVVANFKETQVGHMRIGQPVSIRIDALSDEPLDGEVESFSPGTGSQFALLPANNATGNFTKVVQRVPVRIRLKANPQARPVLVAGMSVTVAVDTAANHDTLAQERRGGAQDSGS